jgi:hypothetical protein
MDSVESKKIYYLAVVIGSLVGAYLPAIVGVSLLSVTDVICSAIGAFVAVYITYKLFN